MKMETVDRRVEAILKSLWKRVRGSRVTHQDLKMAMVDIGLVNDRTHENWVMVLGSRGHIRLIERRPVCIYEVAWPTSIRLEIFTPEVKR